MFCPVTFEITRVDCIRICARIQAYIFTILEYFPFFFQAFQSSGKQLEIQFGMPLAMERSLNASNDMSLNYLGYWTDNGKLFLPSELQHSISYKIACGPSEDSDQPALLFLVQSSILRW